MNALRSVKELFIDFLKDAAIEHTQKGTKMALVYNRALEKLRQHDLEITEIKQLKKIQFIGDRTADFLCKKLQAHCKSNALDFPDSFNIMSSDKRKQVDSDDKPKKKTKRTNYLPKRRAGSWAILIALYLKDRRGRGLRKDEITSTAAEYCDGSFNSNPGAGVFYSAWDGIKVLINRDYVHVSASTPKLYTLTESGLSLAKVLIDQEGISVSPIRQDVSDMSFDNGIRISPNNTFSSSQYTKSQNEVANNLQSSPSKPIEIANSSSPNISFIHPDPNLLTSPSKTDKHLSPLKNVTSNILFNTIDSSPSRVQKPSEEEIMSSPKRKDSLKYHHDRAKRVYADIAYEIWSSTDYEIVPIIDNREIRSSKERDYFESKLGSHNVKCDVRPLSLGDILWIAKHRTTKKEVVLDFVCERKRIDDLAASIKDGRFQEQKSRLKKSGLRYVYYLVEEMMADFNGGEMLESIKSAISMTMTVSKFYVRKFKNLDSTISYIATLTNVIHDKYIGEGKKLIVLKPRSIDNQDEFRSQLNLFRDKFETEKGSYLCTHLFPLFQDAMPKTGMMTVKEYFILMLMTIRGISLEKALVIQKHFQTPKVLIEFFILHKHDTESVKKNLIGNLFKNEIGNKKIGKQALENVYLAWGM
ncbi:crossover junction endonuclease MUS81 [Hyphopichia burtonii NRRL Y-1933]|uniref:Crossover junction endonuclease MUS81 n=1 Tax=Hyphopichia burtonii NRRL Y-1933 TaxID=984485 RepID=A0A1E4RME4_9ASCO|nr:crossover junction endonuclease MUS81 [Hyphopichia burtonii NRRL Y-1933]ODV68416.1 crossover junction endonuclease MUS81 [Hyphopichia burtonii NRRL Y-1933]